jgi:putative ABC transport system permease protein
MSKDDGPTEQIVLLARSFDAGQPLRLDIAEGDSNQLHKQFAEGQIAMGTVLAHRLGVTVGDEVKLKQGGRSTPLRVAALVTDYTGGGMSTYMKWENAKDVLSLRGIHALEVSAKPGREEEAQAALQAYCAEHDLVMQTNKELRDIVFGIVGRVEAFLYMLIALLFVVASLGVVNTLTMNVLEQTRELGVLRAVGLRRSQARKMVLSQALLMALIGAVTGLAVGLVLALLMNLATEPLLGQRVPFRIDFVYVSGCVLASMVVAVVAGLLPARTAARLPIIAALHHD